MPTFQNRQLVPTNDISADFEKLNLNNNEIAVDLQEQSDQLVQIIEETDLDPNKDPEVTNARDSAPFDTIYATVKERLDAAEELISGKNYIINGNFDRWVRGTSFSPAGSGEYVADRWQNISGAIDNITRQATLGTEPFSADYYMQIDRIAASNNNISYELNGIKRFAGRKMIISYWAKASISTTINTRVIIDSANVALPAHSVTTSWQQFFIEIDMPSSITIDLMQILLIRNDVIATYSLAQVKFELGDIATKFVPKTLAEVSEEAYEFTWIPETNSVFVRANQPTLNAIVFHVPLPKNLRIDPTILGIANTDIIVKTLSGAAQTGFTFAALKTSNGVQVTATKTTHGLSDAQLEITINSGFDSEI